MPRIIVLLCLVATLASRARAQESASAPAQAQQSAVAQAAALEDFDKQLGPFEIRGQPFTVLLHMKRVRGQRAVVDPDSQETLSKMEIKDAGGAVHYERTFPLSEVFEGSFAETIHASAQPLQGKQGSGLLVTYGASPSTPLGGLSWQVFSLFAGPPSAPMNGKLVPFSKPIFLEGSLINGESGEPVVRTSEEPRLQGDVLHFRVWTGNFYVMIPLRILWFQNTIGPAWRCQKMTARGVKPICEVRIEADRAPAEEDTTFVRLHVEPEEGFGTPAHVVVKKDSQVEFLAAETEVVWNEDADGVGLSVSDDVWLKVRIDGKEGWIHTQEDFTAIGLPQAG